LGNATASTVDGDRRIHRAFRLSAAIRFACCALMLSSCPQVTAGQATTDSRPQPAPTTPSPGKALICIYRVSRVVGAAAHDSLFVNGVFLATLISGEYATMEVAPGTVVVSGTPKMYYGGLIYSSAAALNDATKKENERIRIDVEEGKTYYLKWTSGAFATGIKVTPVDQATGAKEMSKLHRSKAPEAKSDKE
jgi:hypothetical protein